MRKVALLATMMLMVFGFSWGLKTSYEGLAAVYAKVLVTLANESRLTGGALKENILLTLAAQSKANDMAKNGYFSHVTPTGKTPWQWITEAGYNYAYAGENLAVNFTESEDVNKAWLNSPSHRANIVNGKFTEIGIATAEGMYNGQKATYVVQMFGTPLKTYFVQNKNIEPKVRPLVESKPVPDVLGDFVAVRNVAPSQNLWIIISVLGIIGMGFGLGFVTRKA
jgi:hypothetical protein